VRKRRNPFGISPESLVLLGGLFLLAAKPDMVRRWLPDGVPDATGFRIGNINYYAWAFRGADQDVKVWFTHSGPAQDVIVGAALAPGKGFILGTFGQHNDPVWERSTTVRVNDDPTWTEYNTDIIGKMDVDNFKSYDLYVYIKSPAGELLKDEWRPGAIYIA